MTKQHAFIPIWTVVIIAVAAAFSLHLAMRGKTIALGYELGRARAEQARLREVKRVLQVEAASYKTPERVEIVARTLLGMEPPTPERIIQLAPITEKPDDRTGAQSDEAAQPRAVAGNGKGPP